MLRTAALAVVAYMAWGLVFSDHGYLVYRDESAQLQALQNQVDRLKQEREQLAQKILRLRNDPDALEELVHRDLGYVHQDEFMLLMPDDKHVPLAKGMAESKDTAEAKGMAEGNNVKQAAKP